MYKRGKMSSEKLVFGDKEVDKKEFYSSKQAIPLNSVNISKIIVSNKWKINDISSKLFIGYLDNDIIKPLCIILPRMNGFIKYFDNNNKNMSFITDDESIYSKNSEVWDRIKKLLKTKFNSNPIHDKKYLVAKSKIFNNVNKTTFTYDMIPNEKNTYACIAVIDVDSVLKVDKKVFPQIYLEQCK